MTEYTDGAIRRYVEKVVSEAAPLTQSQRDRLAQLLKPAREALADKRIDRSQMGSGTHHHYREELMLMSTTSTGAEALKDFLSNDQLRASSPTELDIRVELITPKIAKEWLGDNLNNRNPKMMRVKQYAADMRSGNWRLNGEAIKKSTTGRLLDGQNRLFACIEADTPFLTLVVRGLDDVVDQMTMDTGSSRSYSDVLKMRGETNCTALASAVRGVTLWNMGMRRFSDGGGWCCPRGCRSGSRRPLQRHPRCHPEQHPRLAGRCPTLKRMGGNLGIPTQISGALWVAFHAIDADDAQHFFERLESDEGHRDGDPIFALRRLLLNNRRTSAVMPAGRSSWPGSSRRGTSTGKGLR